MRFRLTEDMEHRKVVCRQVWRAPAGMECLLREPIRSNAQNDRLHAVIRDVARQRGQWFGMDVDEEDWKRLLVEAYSRAQGRANRVVPDLGQGGVVILGRQTRKFSVAEANEFVEFVHAWMAEQGLEITNVGG